MEKIMEKPYVISEELNIPGVYSEQYIQLNKLDNFRSELDADLRGMGKNTVWVPSETLDRGIAKMMNETSLPVVSLDDRYVKTANQYIGISRGVDSALNDVGYVPRANYMPVSNQFDRVGQLGSEVVLVDDVLFSGEMMQWVIDELAKRSVKVGGVVCGIAMGDGIRRLAENGVDVQACEVFKDVEDEICERDFAIVPGSGRRVDTANANALYFDTINGRPEQWASIPAELSEVFYQNSLRRSEVLVQDDVQMQSIGKFLGFTEKGNARQLIRERMEAQL